MTLVYILLLLFAFSYVPIGRWIACAFGEDGNTRYILAWPAVLVWLFGVIFEDFPSLTREWLDNMCTPYIEED